MRALAAAFTLGVVVCAGDAGVKPAITASPSPRLGRGSAKPRGSITMQADAASKRVRFLFSDTGGGHRASALALKQRMEALHPDVECDLVDMFVETGQLPFSAFPELYRWLAANPLAWKILFELGATPVGLLLHEVITDLTCASSFRKQVSAAPRPDLLVSVHPLLQGPVLRAVARADGGRRHRAFATVITDLGSAHPTWFHQDVDLCFVPSDVLSELARRAGLKSTQVRPEKVRPATGVWPDALALPGLPPAPQVVQHGLPIREGFTRHAGDSTPKEKARKHLGLDVLRPTVLVVGGGDGVGALESTAEAIADRLAADDVSAQVIVICGRNEVTRRALAARQWNGSLRVVVEGYVDNMDEYMAAADVLVTKAGPGTIAEAATMGIPCALSSFLPGQEEGNVDFVRNAGFGDYCASPEGLARLVSRWLHDGALLTRMSKAAREAARPDATTRIAQHLYELMNDGS